MVYNPGGSEWEGIMWRHERRIKHEVPSPLLTCVGCIILVFYVGVGNVLEASGRCLCAGSSWTEFLQKEF